MSDVSRRRFLGLTGAGAGAVALSWTTGPVAQAAGNHPDDLAEQAAASHPDGLAQVAASHHDAPAGLRAAAMDDVLGLADPAPPLGWRLAGGGQSAYQVQVATDLKLLRSGRPDLWDTGRVNAAAQQVTYAGKPIGSRTGAYWRVRTWDGDRASHWSDADWFETGLEDASDWKAQWIGHPDWQVSAKQPVPIVVQVPPTTAQYVRIAVTRLGLPLVENLPGPTYRLQLAEIQVMDTSSGSNQAAGRTATANDTGGLVNRVWATRYLTDGTLTTNQQFAGWSSSAYPSADVSATPIVLTIDLKSAKPFDRILLYPRTDTPASTGQVPYGPVDFTVASSTDNAAYTTLATVTGQDQPASLMPVALPIFATDFALPYDVHEARLYVAGLGVYEVTLNGERVGDAVLEPANTGFATRVQYATYDVTSLLRRGGNALGVALGNGIANVISTPDRYRKFQGTVSDPKMIAQLEVTMAGGRTRRIVSDPGWKTTLGPVTFSHWYGGEDHDARREIRGWDRPGARRNGWSQAVAVSPPGSSPGSPPGSPPGPSSVLSGRAAPPIRVVETLPGRLVGSGSGWQVYDLGRNIAGRPEITIEAPAGTTVRIYPGEGLTGDGRVLQSISTVGAPLWDQYTTASDREATWHPRFCYHGFRYLEVRNLPAGASIRVRGHVLRSDTPSAGSFECSNAIVNGVHWLVRRAIEGNMMSILTDCPSREKLGWLEQDHLVNEALTANYDVRALLRKIVQDMADAQTAEGMIPSTVPDYVVFGGAYRDDANWGGSFVIVPWQLYRTYGDADTMARHYDAMARYAAYLQARAVNGLTDYSLGDWITPDTAFPKFVSGTYGYWRVLDAMARIATVLGKPADATNYRSLANGSAKALSDKYYKDGTFADGGMGAEALALDMRAVPDDAAWNRLFAHLVSTVEASGYHALLGEISWPSLLNVLSAGGRDDIVYQIATQTTSPSLGYQVVHGQTALGESWDGGNSASGNHFMLGAIDGWFIRRLAGIGQTGESVGFRSLLVAPSVVGDLTHASGTYQTLYGQVRSAWKRASGGRVELTVTVPPGCTAEVHVPVSGAVHTVGPGTWTFTSDSPSLHSAQGA
jgi:alpha-L-rhamnosidase